MDFSDSYVSTEQRLLVRLDDDRFDGPEAFAADEDAILSQQVGTTNYSVAEELVGDDSKTLQEWLQKHSRNYPVLAARAIQAVQDRDWVAAAELGRRLIELYPDNSGSDSADLLLARAYRELGRTEDERAALSRFAERSPDGVDAFLRLLKLECEAEDWPSVMTTARRLLAVNPLLLQTWRAISEAAEHLNRPHDAIGAWQAMLAMGPEDPAEAHFRLAYLLHVQGDPQAKSHVLQALEEAPRYRDAHRLLLEITRPAESGDQSPTVSPAVNQ